MYLIMCIVFKIHPFFSFCTSLILFRAVLENMVRKDLDIDHMLNMVCPAGH